MRLRRIGQWWRAVVGWVPANAWVFAIILGIAVLVVTVFRHLGWIKIDEIDLVLIAFIAALLLLPFAESVTAGPFSFKWRQRQAARQLAERTEREVEKTLVEIAPQVPNVEVATGSRVPTTGGIGGIIVSGTRKELEREIEALYRDVIRLLQQKARKRGVTLRNKQIREIAAAELDPLQQKEWKAVDDMRSAVRVNGAGVHLQTLKNAAAAGQDLKTTLQADVEAATPTQA